MFLDARQLDADVTLEADVCIVGAGAAGITLARDLRGSGLRVIVLESGGFESDADIQDLYAGERTGIRALWALGQMRIRRFGGSTGHWGGWCRPLGPEDFESRDYIPHSGWPIGYEDLVPWYRRAQKTLEIGPFSYSIDDLELKTASVLPIAPGTVEPRLYQLSRPTRFGKRYREDLELARDVSVHLHANLLEIVLDEGSGERVSHLHCGTLDGKRFRVRAGRYVLAMGAIENARMLLASRNQRSEGVANSSDAVGRYFMEHPHYRDSVVLLFAAPIDLGFYIPHPAVWKTGLSPEGTAPGLRNRIQGALALSPEVRRRERLPAFTAIVKPRKRTDLETGAIDPRTISALTRGRLAQLAQLTCRMEQTPDPRSRVTLGEERDALGLPRTRLQWEIREGDRLAYARALRIFATAFAAAGLGRVWTPVDEAGLRARIAPGGHHMGTTRMGDDPRASVVDANLRTHDVSNLFIAGSSVYATGGDANPTLTLVALAHRLAAHLKESV